MPDSVKVKGGKREGSGRKATKEGSGSTIYVPNDLLPLIREMITEYKSKKIKAIKSTWQNL